MLKFINIIAPVNRHLPQLYAHVSLLGAIKFIQYNTLGGVYVCVYNTDYLAILC